MAVTAAEKEYRIVRLVCSVCEKSREFRGAQGEDVSGAIRMSGWELLKGGFAIKRENRREDRLGRCPVCIGLGRTKGRKHTVDSKAK